MPTVTVVPQTAWAHCPHPVCPGSAQQEVKAERVETSYLYTDNGGDIPGVERSNMEFRFADEADVACSSCGRPREVTGQVRPSYDPLSGFDPMGLVNGTVAPFDAAVRNTEQDAEVAELRAQVARLAALIEGKKGD